MPIEHILAFEDKLELADVGAAFLGQPAPYQILLQKKLAHLHAFEADQRQHPGIKKAYGHLTTLYSDIIGDGSKQTLHIASPESGMTSLLKPSQNHLEFFNGFSSIGKVYETQSVQTCKLDDVTGLPQLDYLKMDIQGAELQVLNSGSSKLSDCVAIHLEVSFVPLYEHQPCFGDIDCWMRKKGYLPHTFADVKRWSIAPTIRDGNFRIPFNQLLEADIVYVKDPTALDALKSAAIKKLAIIAHYCLQSPDLVVHLIKHLEQVKELAPNSFQLYLNSLQSKK